MMGNKLEKFYISLSNFIYIVFEKMKQVTDTVIFKPFEKYVWNWILENHLIVMAIMGAIIIIPPAVRLFTN